MKSSLAAFVTAIEAFVAAHPRRAGLDRAARHLRRGRSVDRRHGQGRRAARGARRAHRLLHRRRAVVGRRARRHDQERPPRHAVRHADRQGRPGSRRLPAAGAQPDPPRRAGARRARGDATGTTATTTSRRRPGSARTSTPAPARPTSFPARSSCMFNFRYSHRAARANRSRSASRRSSRGTASTTTSPGPDRASRS